MKNWKELVLSRNWKYKFEIEMMPTLAEPFHRRSHLCPKLEWISPPASFVDGLSREQYLLKWWRTYHHEHLAEPTLTMKESLPFVPIHEIQINWTYNVIALLVVRFFQDIWNLDESFFWETLENRYAAKKNLFWIKVTEIPLFEALNYVNTFQFHFLQVNISVVANFDISEANEELSSKKKICELNCAKRIL